MMELLELREINLPQLIAFFSAISAKSRGKLRRVDSASDVRGPGDVYVTHNLKSEQSILAKTVRPKVLAEYPKYEMQHIRDALRFKAIVYSFADAFRFLALLIDQEGWEVVKLDLKKFLKPKKFGWRFIGCDLRIGDYASGKQMLVECYITFAEMMDVDLGNHRAFEDWRGKDFDKLTTKERQMMEAAAKESTKRYNKAIRKTLKRTTLDDFEALFSAFPSEVRDQAVAVYNEILSANVSPLVETESAAEVYQRAANSLQRNEHEEAAELFLKAHELGGLPTEQMADCMQKCAEAWFEAAKWHYEEKNFERAHSCSKKARKRWGRGLPRAVKRQARELESRCKSIQHDGELTAADTTTLTATVTTTLDSVPEGLEDVFRRGEP